MGTLALAAKITHVPSMYLSELDGPHKGCRKAAIDGHHEIGRRCRALGVDTIVVFDVHWLVNSEYHINCAPHFKGVYTSNELPHFIKNMPYEYPGNPELGQLIADTANEMGVVSRAHRDTTLELEYGTLVPMRYMNGDQHFKVVSVSGWCMWHNLEESARFGLAVRKAIEDRYDGTVAVFASGSLSHHFANNGTAPQYMHKVFDPFLESVDHGVVAMWEKGDWHTFVDMLPMYNEKCWGEGGMHDTAMLLGMLGGRDYDQKVEVITPYFGSSGTGQINAIFPVTPLKSTATA
ncbi:MAG: 3,4-dihydroxyphenylacetate 2,3-dioxygenase [Burkholderiaceae bacterium]|nr:MAG: 3,4-dihydroxyphenylacetate 2,3-dioxygenase [Burkholderiaceae bacterium]TAM05165.1 MAG: 3,4-dihydroxyphenylacetate 2,3-dioxygenase [Pusillimonas sp.]